MNHSIGVISLEKALESEPSLAEGIHGRALQRRCGMQWKFEIQNSIQLSKGCKYQYCT